METKQYEYVNYFFNQTIIVKVSKRTGRFRIHKKEKPVDNFIILKEMEKILFKKAVFNAYMKYP